MKRLLRFLGSLRVTIILIVALTAIFLLGQIIPQRNVLQGGLYEQWQVSRPGLVEVLDWSGLTHIYSSPITLSVWVLFFVNLALVMWRRYGIVRALIALHPNKVRGFDAVRGKRSSIAFDAPPGARLVDLEGFFSRRRFAVLMGRGGFYAVRNRLSPVANLVFHLSFFVILAGGALSFYTRFTATVDLGEGEVFTGAVEQYRSPPEPPLLGEMPKVYLMVHEIEPVAVGDTPVGIVATIVDRDGRTHTAEINRPYRQGNCSFVIQDLGAAPQVVLRSRDGGIVDAAWVKLNVMQGKEDRFTLAGLDFTVRFFPDLVFEDGQPRTASLRFDRPAFQLAAWRDGAPVADVLVEPGQSADLGDLDLEIGELRFWIRFYVRQESGLWLVWSGFAIALAALLERLVRYRREYWVAYTGEGGALDEVVVAGRSEFFRALFQDEFRELVDQVRAHLEKGAAR